MDAAQIAGVLFQIKQSPQDLEDTLEEVGKKYSADLCQIIRTMLRRNFQQRSTSLELADLPYVKQCLLMSGSSLAASDSNKKATKKAKPVPKEKGLEAVLAYMKENEDSVSCQIEAMKCLVDFVKKDKDMSAGGKKLVASIMKKHVADEEVLKHGCTLLAKLAAKAEEDDVLFTRELIAPVALAMKAHAGSVSLQAAGCQHLMALSADEAAAEEIGKLGGVQDILAAMRAFPNNADIAAYCCGALWSLAVNENNAKIITEERGLQDVCKAMETHSTISDVVEAACSALWSLSMEDENIEMMSGGGVISLILQALQVHVKDIKVVKNACMALASIVEADEASAYEVLNGDGETHGADILLAAFMANKTSEEVAENFSCAVAELGEYDDIREELKSKKFQDVLAEAKIKFASKGEVVDAINNALVSLGEARGSRRSGSSRSRPRSAAAKK